MLIDKFSEDDVRRAKTSGGEEDVSEMDALLADVALEIEEMSRVASGRREAAAARKGRLEEEGLAVRSAAVGRSRKAMEGEGAGGVFSQEGDEEREESSESEGGGRRKRRRGRLLEGLMRRRPWIELKVWRKRGGRWSWKG